MKIKGATTVLNKECEFLGLSWDQLMQFIERNPLAMPIKVLEEYEVYINE